LRFQINSNGFSEVNVLGISYELETDEEIQRQTKTDDIDCSHTRLSTDVHSLKKTSKLHKIFRID
jgi:hypothetical protein